MQKKITQTGIGSDRARLMALAFTVLLTHNAAIGAQATLNLGTAGNYVILAKSGISTVPPSAVTGNIAVSPIESSAITGFSLILDSSGQFSTSSQVTGKVYAPDYAAPTPVNLTTAVSDMQTAYTDAAGRTLPDYTELGSGDIGGLTLAAGLYKWSTGVTIPSNVTLSGGSNDIWIFQIAGDLTLSGATDVILSGGAQAQNIFWQVAGGVGVDLGTTSQFAGTILTQAAINMATGASINGRLLAQTAVTLDANSITVSPVLPSPPSFGPITPPLNGSVTLVITNTPDLALTIQTSTNLINWTTLATPTPTVSPFTFTDTTASSTGTRFYRAFYP
jgi:Ice-binding-like